MCPASKAQSPLNTEVISFLIYIVPTDLQEEQFVPPSETIELSSMPVEDSYDGPRMEGVPTFQIMIGWGVIDL